VSPKRIHEFLTAFATRDKEQQHCKYALVNRVPAGTYKVGYRYTELEVYKMFLVRKKQCLSYTRFIERNIRGIRDFLTLPLKLDLC